MKDPSAIAKPVQEVFLVPPDFPAMSAELVDLVALLEGERRTVAESFLNSLRGVVSTLTIPFTYTYAQVHSLQWQGDKSIIYWKIDEDRFNKENVDNRSRILFLLKEGDS